MDHVPSKTIKLSNPCHRTQWQKQDQCLWDSRSSVIKWEFQSWVILWLNDTWLFEHFSLFFNFSSNGGTVCMFAFSASTRMEMPYYFFLDVRVLMLRLKWRGEKACGVRRQSNPWLSLETIAGVGQSHGSDGEGVILGNLIEERGWLGR